MHVLAARQDDQLDGTGGGEGRLVVDVGVQFLARHYGGSDRGGGYRLDARVSATVSRGEYIRGSLFLGGEGQGRGRFVGRLGLRRLAGGIPVVGLVCERWRLGGMRGAKRGDHEGGDTEHEHRSGGGGHRGPGRSLEGQYSPGLDSGSDGDGPGDQFVGDGPFVAEQLQRRELGLELIQPAATGLAQVEMSVRLGLGGLVGQVEGVVDQPLFRGMLVHLVTLIESGSCRAKRARARDIWVLTVPTEQSRTWATSG